MRSRTRTGARRRRDSGFTLVELAVVVAVLAVLVSVTILAMRGMKTRGNFASATGELLVTIRELRSESFSRANSTVLIVDTVGKRYWGLEDVNEDLTLDLFDPNSPTSNGDRLISSGVLPDSVSFGPSDGYGAALPQPFQLIPTSTSSSPAANFAYCSFCETSGSRLGYGLMRFSRSGMKYNASAPGAASGQQLTLSAQLSGTARTVLTIAVLSRTGATTTFETLR